MNRRKAVSLSSLIPDVLHLNGLDTPMAERRVVAAWPTVVGEQAARYTREVTMRGNMLIVRLNSAALRSELLLSRHLLIDRINREARTNIVHDIRLL